MSFNFGSPETSSRELKALADITSQFPDLKYVTRELRLSASELTQRELDQIAWTGIKEAKVSRALPLVLMSMYVASCMMPLDSHGVPTSMPDLAQPKSSDLTPQAPSFSAAIPDMPKAFGADYAMVLNTENSLNPDACSGISRQPITYYAPDNQLVKADHMSDVGYTPLFSFFVEGSDGKKPMEFCLATTDLDSLHLLVNGDDAWNDMIVGLEAPGEDGLFKVGDEMFSPLGIFTKNGATPIIGFGVDNEGNFNGKAVVSVDGNYHELSLGNMDFGKGLGLESMAPQFRAKHTELIGQLDNWGLEPQSYNYTYHPEGDLGVDLGQGVFLNVDGNAVIHIGGSSFDEIDPANVVMKDGKLAGIKGYELSKDGYWVEAMTPSESQLYSDMEKWGIDLSGKDSEKYSATISGEDVTIVDKESGEIIYKNGSWEPVFLGRMIKTSDNGCKVTPFISGNIGATNPPDAKKLTDEYGQSLTDTYLLFVKNKVIPSSGMKFQYFNIGDGCWGKVFYKSEGMYQPVAQYFWKDELGRVKHEQVFIDVKK